MKVPVFVVCEVNSVTLSVENLRSDHEAFTLITQLRLHQQLQHAAQKEYPDITQLRLHQQLQHATQKEYPDILLGCPTSLLPVYAKISALTVENVSSNSLVYFVNYKAPK
jgi:hypothetical protein